MAKTRSKGPISPKTPLSEKVKKIKSKTEVEASPTAQKVKKGKVEKPKGKPAKATKSATKDTKKGTSSEIVSDKVAKGALEQLKKYVKSQEKPSTKSDLFEDEEDDQYAYLQITTKKFYSGKPNFKPKVIKLSNPIIQQDEVNEVKTCLIVRDDLITTNEELEKIEQEKIPTLSKILTLKDIKTEFKPFEKKRQLYSDYDLFLIDDALLNSMPHLLGKVFYDNGNSKIPLPIRVTNSTNTKKLSLDTLKNQISKSLSSTFFLPPMGVNILIRFGAINKQLVDDLSNNIQDVLKTFDASSLRSVMLKTSTSPALPLFYNDKLYDSEDVLENVTKANKSDNVDLTAYEKGLLEIGTTEDVTKVIGKKLKQKLKSKQA